MAARGMASIKSGHLNSHDDIVLLDSQRKENRIVSIVFKWAPAALSAIWKHHDLDVVNYLVQGNSVALGVDWISSTDDKLHAARKSLQRV